MQVLIATFHFSIKANELLVKMGQKPYRIFS